MDVRREGALRGVSNDGRCASDLVTDTVEHSALHTLHWRAHPGRFSRMDRGTLGEVGVDPHDRRLVFKAASCLTALDDGLAFLLGAAIGATPAHGDPLWMLVDPLRDVGLRIHDALIERHVGRERNMLIFALAG